MLMSGGGIKQKTLWLAGIVAASFCIWRIAVFIPQPLDSTATLRPFLYRLFRAFIGAYPGPELAFSAWYTVGLATILMPPALVVLNYAVRRHEPRSRNLIVMGLCSRTALFIVIALCLCVCRFPTLLEPELNPDEGQFIAAAQKLFYDANFFRAADCGTSGPLNIYPLMLPAIFGISPDYSSSRIIVLVVVFLCIWLFYRTIALIASDEIARIAIIPIAGLFAVFRHPNLIHYSSEHIPVLLASIALYAVVRVLRSPAKYRSPIFLLGFLGSAAFFAKLQAVPMLAVLAAVAIAYVYIARGTHKAWSPILVFIAGALPLQALNILLCLAAGVWQDFWMSYIVTNQHYADVENRFISDLPQLLKYLGDTDEVRAFLFTFLGLWAAYVFQRTRREDASVPAVFLQSAAVSVLTVAVTAGLYLSNLSGLSSYIALAAVTVTPMYFLLNLRERPFGRDPVRWFGFLAVLFTLVAMFSVYAAHRPFPHYLLFLFIPVCTAIAWMLIRQAGAMEPAGQYHSFAVAFPALVVVLAVVCQTLLWGSQDDHIFKKVSSTIRSQEGDFIRSVTSSNGKIAVWGWTVAPYLSSGRTAATRDTNMANFFRWPDISAYYRQRFLSDMRKDPPEVFIDAVGPASWSLTDRKLYTFEQFPEIESFIRARYVPLEDLYGEHFFLRGDIALRRGIGVKR